MFCVAVTWSIHQGQSLSFQPSQLQFTCQPTEGFTILFQHASFNGFRITVCLINVLMCPLVIFFCKKETSTKSEKSLYKMIAMGHNHINRCKDNAASQGHSGVQWEYERRNYHGPTLS